MPFASIGVNIAISLISTGIGAFAHWLAAKHTRKSAAAAAVATATATALAKASVPVTSTTAAKVTAK